MLEAGLRPPKGVGRLRTSRSVDGLCRADLPAELGADQGRDLQRTKVGICSCTAALDLLVMEDCRALGGLSARHFAWHLDEPLVNTYETLFLRYFLKDRRSPSSRVTGTPAAL